MKFSALNVDFSSLSPDFIDSWSPAQAGIKDFKDFGTGVGGVE